MNRDMTETTNKVAEVTFLFWVIKILATTLGETGGDALSMTMNLGYAVSTAIFGVLFVAALAAQIAARNFHPFLYWIVIVATTTVGTTMADFADRSLGIGYVGGSLGLLALLMLTLGAWRLALGSVAVDHITSWKAEAFYWVTIVFSNTLGTALGDFFADDFRAGLSRRGRRVRRLPRSDRRRVFFHEAAAHVALLGGVHFDASARGHARRPPDQILQRGRLEPQPHRIDGDHRAGDDRLYPVLRPRIEERAR